MNPATPAGSGSSATDTPSQSGSGKEDDGEDFQHLEPHVHVASGDKIRVFYKFDNIYEAKVKRVQARDNCKWPRYLVHYQGWNARYDEWIKRSKIKENLSWTKDRELPEVEPAPKDEPGQTEPEPVATVVETKPLERKKPGPKSGAGAGPVGKVTPLKKIADKTAAAPPSETTTKAVERNSSGPKDNSRAGTPSSVTSKGSRTGSPALKRQSSRTSNKKETDSDEEDSEANSRKSSRLTKTNSIPAVSSPSTTSATSSSSADTRRGSRKRFAVKPEESETEDVEVEKDDAKQESRAGSAASTEDVAPTKPKRGRKPTRPAVVEDSGSEVEQSKTEANTRSSRYTPTREKQQQRASTPRGGGKINSGASSRGSSRSSGRFNASNAAAEEEEDPYAFKEPENVEIAKIEKSTSSGDKAIGKKIKSEDRSNGGGGSGDDGGKTKLVKIESLDSTDSSSSDVELTKKSSTSAGTRSSQRSSRKLGGQVTTSSEDDNEKINSNDNNDHEIKDHGGATTTGDSIKPETETAPPTMAETKPTAMHQFTKKQQEIFPNLASKMTTNSPAATTKLPTTTSSNIPVPPETVSSSSSEAASPSTIPAKSDISGSGSTKQSSTTESSSVSLEPETVRKPRKTPNKPKSDELVDSETESDSSIETSVERAGRQKSNTPPPRKIQATTVSTVEKPPKKSRRKLLVEESDAPVTSPTVVDEDEPLIRSSTSRRSENKVISAGNSNASRKLTKSAAAASMKSGTGNSGSTVTAEDVSGVQGGDDLDLACAETIPGSPVHPSSTSTAGSTSTSPIDTVKTNNVVDKSNTSGTSHGSRPNSSNLTHLDQTSTRLEMPFASVPESVEAGPVTSNAGSTVSNNMPATLPPTSETPETTATSTPSRLSPIGALANAAMVALAGSNDDGSKSPGGGDSSEVDMESLKAESVDIEGSSSGQDAKLQRGVKRKAPMSDVGSRSPAQAPRRKRRTRESGHRGGRGGSRGHHSSGVRGHNNDDTDESEEAKDAALSVIGSLDNDALAALAQQSPKSTKFNFCPDFGKSVYVTFNV